MAYRYREPPYYGDETPQYTPDPHPPSSEGSGGGGGGSGEITEIDFDKVDVYNDPWLKRRSLKVAMSKVSPNKSTNLGGANMRIDEVVNGLKECAK